MYPVVSASGGFMFKPQDFALKPPLFSTDLYVGTVVLCQKTWYIGNERIGMIPGIRATVPRL